MYGPCCALVLENHVGSYCHIFSCLLWVPVGYCIVSVGTLQGTVGTAGGNSDSWVLAILEGTSAWVSCSGSDWLLLYRTLVLEHGSVDGRRRKNERSDYYM